MGLRAGSWFSLALTGTGLACVALAGLLSGTAQAASGDDKDFRLVMSAKAHGAAVYQKSDWPTCEPTMKFIVLAGDAGLFAGDYPNLQKLVSGVRAVTGISCRAMKALQVFGIAKKELAFTGYAEASNNWRLIRVERRDEPSQKSAQQPAPPAQQAPAPAPQTQPAVADQQFFAALSRGDPEPSEPEPAEPVASPGTLAPGARPQASVPAPPSPPSGSLSDGVDATNYRDVYEYRKLTANIDQLLGVDLATLAEICSQDAGTDGSTSRGHEILLRLCRAVSYARNDPTEAAGYGERIAGR